eukprot:3096628-Rhodomonas_salina.1
MIESLPCFLLPALPAHPRSSSFSLPSLHLQAPSSLPQTLCLPRREEGGGEGERETLSWREEERRRERWRRSGGRDREEQGDVGRERRREGEKEGRRERVSV